MVAAHVVEGGGGGGGWGAAGRAASRRGHDVERQHLEDVQREVSELVELAEQKVFDIADRGQHGGVDLGHRRFDWFGGDRWSR